MESGPFIQVPAQLWWHQWLLAWPGWEGFSPDVPPVSLTSVHGHPVGMGLPC